jgi:hypothetical protein
LFHFMLEPQPIILYMFMLSVSHIQLWSKVLRFGNKDERILELCHSATHIITDTVMWMKLCGILFGCYIGSWHFSYITLNCIVN